MMYYNQSIGNDSTALMPHCSINWFLIFCEPNRLITLITASIGIMNNAIEILIFNSQGMKNMNSIILSLISICDITNLLFYFTYTLFQCREPHTSILIAMVSNAYGFVQSFCKACSIWLLVCVSYERHQVICEPLHALLTSWKVYTFKLGIIIMPLFFATTSATLYRLLFWYTFNNGTVVVKQALITNKAFVRFQLTLELLTSYILPTTIILILTFRTTRSLIRAKIIRKTMVSSRQTTQNRTTYMVITIAIMFIVSKSIPGAALCIFFLRHDIQGNACDTYYMFFVGILDFLRFILNLSMDNWIYFFFSKNYRRKLLSIVCCCLKQFRGHNSLFNNRKNSMLPTSRILCNQNSYLATTAAGRCSVQYATANRLNTSAASLLQPQGNRNRRMTTIGVLPTPTHHRLINTDDQVAASDKEDHADNHQKRTTVRLIEPILTSTPSDPDMLTTVLLSGHTGPPQNISLDKCCSADTINHDCEHIELNTLFYLAEDQSSSN